MTLLVSYFTPISYFSASFLYSVLIFALPIFALPFFVSHLFIFFYPFLFLFVYLYYFFNFHFLIFLFFNLSAQCIERYKVFKLSKSSSSAAEQKEELERLQRGFNSLKTKDISLIKVGVDFTDALLPTAIEICSAVTDTDTNTAHTHKQGSNSKALAAIGVLAWFCVKIRPSVLNKFPLYLKALYESDNEVVDEVVIKAWHAAVEGNIIILNNLKYSPQFVILSLFLF